MKIELRKGKYTYIVHADGSNEVLRYGEQWRDTTGDGFILAMAQRIEELEEEIIERNELDKCNERLMQQLQAENAELRESEKRFLRGLLVTLKNKQAEQAEVFIRSRYGKLDDKREVKKSPKV